MSLLETPGGMTVAAEMARADLYWFSRIMFKARRGFKWQHAMHHPVVCKALMRVYEGTCRRLIINMPPRYSKTELAVVNFVPWALGHCPDAEFIHVSYALDLVRANSYQAREIVWHPTYRQIFPKTLIDPNIGGADDWRTTDGGVLYARQSGGPITGFGAGKKRPGFGGALLIDDPHKADDIRHDAKRLIPIHHYQNTLQSRLNDPENTPVIVVMQRLHEEDLTGWLLSGGTGEEWELVCIPALAEDEDDILGRKPGQALWPEMHSAERLRAMEKAMPSVFAGQYQQRPAPAEGLIFKPENLVYVDAPPPDVRWCRGWDLAATKDGGDWTRGAKLGLTKDLRLIIGDMQGVQGTPDEVEALIKSTAAMDGRDVRISIPQDPAQAGKAQVVSYTRLLHGHILEFSREEGSKETRADALASQVNLGNVMVVRGDWNAAMVHEMRMFPNGKFDDQIDAMTRAYRNLLLDQAGDAFFAVEPLLAGGAPVDLPTHCDAVFATIASNTKTGKPGDAVAVVYWVWDKLTGPWALICEDWELLQVEAASVEAWLPGVHEHLAELARRCGARSGSIGMFCDDSGTGTVLLQHAQRFGGAHAIESRLTSMGKAERAVSVSPYLIGGRVKLAAPAFERVSTFRGITRNHLIGELLAFRVGAKDDAATQDTLLEACMYGAAIGVGTPAGF